MHLKLYLTVVDQHLSLKDQGVMSSGHPMVITIPFLACRILLIRLAIVDFDVRASLSSGTGHGGVNNYNLLSGQFRQGSNNIVLATDKGVIDQTNLFRVHYATLYIYDMWLEK